MQTHVVNHPLVAERLATLRHKESSAPQFRQALNEISSLLVYEATRNLRTIETSVPTPVAVAASKGLAAQPLLVPVLRAGLGMLGAAQALLPQAAVGFIGVRRDETTLQPDAYMSTIPDSDQSAPVLVLDPMLATGGSLIYTCEQILAHQPAELIVVCVLAAPEGIDKFRGAGFTAPIYTAAIDEKLNEDGFIVPGLGDAGDRQFGVQ
ncbi:MAG: uracil phosphoribosyltransferase [Acidimicrobiia bacterium]